MKALSLSETWKPRPDYPLSERELSTARAFVSSQVYANPILRVTDRPIPRPGAGEVLVKVRACGVCGSDLHVCQQGPDGYVAYADHAKLPVVLGHELSGVVEEVGAGVATLAVGDRVCVEPMNWCGACLACRTGMFNQCTDLEEIGFSVDGGFAEYVLTRPRYCWSIDRLADAYASDAAVFEAGALVEPAGVVYNAMFVRAGGFLPGGNVAVFGAGPIGLAAIALARVAGAARISAFDTIPERRELARKLGADDADDPVALGRAGLDLASLVMDRTDGVGVAMGIEAAGAGARTYPELERIVGVGGKIVQVGIGTEPTPIMLVRLQQRGVSVYGSMGNSGHGIFPGVIRLMAAGRLDLTPIITARYALADAIAAFARTSERRDGKVLIKP
ncbi:MAG: scyllo-inosose 3-dehydrogenase [Chloroflexota bacterium]